MSEKYGDIKAVMQIICRGRSEVYRLIKQEGLPKPKKLGSKSLWDLEAVRQWLEANLKEAQ